MFVLLQKMVSLKRSVTVKSLDYVRTAFLLLAIATIAFRFFFLVYREMSVIHVSRSYVVEHHVGGDVSIQAAALDRYFFPFDLAFLAFVCSMLVFEVVVIEWCDRGKHDFPASDRGGPPES